MRRIKFFSNPQVLCQSTLFYILHALKLTLLLINIFYLSFFVQFFFDIGLWFFEICIALFYRLTFNIQSTLEFLETFIFLSIDRELVNYSDRIVVIWLPQIGEITLAKALSFSFQLEAPPIRNLLGKLNCINCENTRGINGYFIQHLSVNAPLLWRFQQ